MSIPYFSAIDDRLARCVVLALLVILLVGCGGDDDGGGQSPPLGHASPWELVWSDEFNGAAGTRVDPDKWLYDIGTGYPGGQPNWGTGEIEVMTDDTANVYHDGEGHLAIKPIRSGDADWTSGRIETRRADFEPPTGGAVAFEASIQQPDVGGDAAAGYWPAFWSLGAPFRDNYLSWPGIGEIDILENINGRSSQFGTLHCGTLDPPNPCDEFTGLGSGEIPCPGCQTAFHTYRAEIDFSVRPEEVRWYLDGRNFFTVRSDRVDETTWRNATHHGFFLILNVAIGGGFPAAFGGGPTADTVSGVPMLVDYVRVYALPGSTPATPAALLKPVTWPGKAPNMTPVDAATAADWQAQAEAELKAQDGLNGLWVAMSDPDKGYWTAAIGDAVAAPATAATIDDHARIGSITKTFTATAILEQVAAGNLALTDTVATVIPDTAAEFPATAGLTVRQLLNMSSGLPDYANAPGTVIPETIKNPTKVWTPQELIANALQTPVSRPGTPGYSTTNTQLLALMLEKITGKPVDQVVTAVARDAGLADTALQPPDQTALPAPSSHGYVDAAFLQDPTVAGTGLAAGTDVTDWTVSWGGAGGGMYSTVRDLFTWAATGLGTALLPPDLAAKRVETNIPALSTAGYGLGIEQPAVGWLGHGGQTLGWTSFAAYNPRTGATIAGLANSPTGIAAVAALWVNILGADNGADCVRSGTYCR